MLSVRPGVIMLASLSLAGCGGGSGSNSNPPVAVAPAPAPAPTPSPTPTPAIVGATDKIVFAANSSGLLFQEGRSFFDGGLSFRYDAATGNTLVTGDYDTEFIPLVRAPGYMPLAGTPWLSFVRGNSRLSILIRASGEHPDPAYRYLYSNLVSWSEPPNSFQGNTALGIVTPVGRGPADAAVTYKGFLEGRTTETYLDDGQRNRGIVKSDVTLVFDPAANRASISLNLEVETDRILTLPLGTVALSWTKGAEAFFQPVPGEPNSRNYPISGRFTGPNAEEVIGSLTASYPSPRDGSMQTLHASFIAKR